MPLAAGGFTLATQFGWLRVLDPAAPLVPGTGVPPTWVIVITAAVKDHLAAGTQPFRRHVKLS
jgi:hypothetical protein